MTCILPSALCSWSIPTTMPFLPFFAKTQGFLTLISPFLSTLICWNWYMELSFSKFEPKTLHESWMRSISAKMGASSLAATIHKLQSSRAECRCWRLHQLARPLKAGGDDLYVIHNNDSPEFLTRFEKLKIMAFSADSLLDNLASCSSSRFQNNETSGEHLPSLIYELDSHVDCNNIVAR